MREQLEVIFELWLNSTVEASETKSPASQKNSSLHNFSLRRIPLASANENQEPSSPKSCAVAEVCVADKGVFGGGGVGRGSCVAAGAIQ